MNVLLLKCYDDNSIENKAAGFIDRKKNRTGSSVKVFCVEETVLKKLALIGIDAEILHAFIIPDYQDEANWSKVFDLSDSLHASVGNKDGLNFAGINFLNLEYHIVKYIFSSRLANLLKMVSEQNYTDVILVLTAPYNEWLVDINTSRIKTYKYGNRATSARVLARLLWRRTHQVPVLFGMIKKRFHKPAADKRTSSLVNVSGRPVVLFAVSDAVYARPALRIAEECLKNGMKPSIATGDLTLLPLLQSQNIEYSVRPSFLTSPLVSLSCILKSYPVLIRISRHVKLFFNSESDEFSTGYLCKIALISELPELCREAVAGIVFLERLMVEVRPVIVCVMPQSGLLQQLAFSMTRKRGIPVLACSAAWETNTTVAFRTHLHADRLAASGDKMRKIYLDSGLEPQRVVAAGLAHFDRLFERDRPHDRQILIGCGIDPDKPYLVLATGLITEEDEEEMLVGVIEAVLKIRDMQLVVKVHPREQVEPYQAIVDRYNSPGLHVVKDVDLYALLGDCKILITRFSTVALEAMMIDKPVVIVNISRVSLPVPYVEEGAAVGVYKFEDIEPAILKVLYNEQTGTELKAGRDKFVRAWAGEPDGMASQRIVSLMKEMIGKNTNR
jgi:hypothetical protein